MLRCEKAGSLEKVKEREGVNIQGKDFPGKKATNHEELEAQMTRESTQPERERIEKSRKGALGRSQSGIAVEPGHSSTMPFPLSTAARRGGAYPKNGES